jgi:hypothetical protein
MTASLPDAATPLTVLRGGPVGSSRMAWRVIPVLAILSLIVSMPSRFSPGALAQEAGTVITLPDLPFVLPVPLTDDEWPH